MKKTIILIIALFIFNSLTTSGMLLCITPNNHIEFELVEPLISSEMPVIANHLAGFTCHIQCMEPLEQYTNKHISGTRVVFNEKLAVKAYTRQEAETKITKTIYQICQDRLPTYVDSTVSCNKDTIE